MSLRSETHWDWRTDIAFVSDLVGVLGARGHQVETTGWGLVVDGRTLRISVSHPSPAAVAWAIATSLGRRSQSGDAGDVVDAVLRLHDVRVRATYSNLVITREGTDLANQGHLQATGGIRHAR